MRSQKREEKNCQAGVFAREFPVVFVVVLPNKGRSVMQGSAMQQPVLCKVIAARRSPYPPALHPIVIVLCN